MKKEEIYVRIKNEEERLRVVEILRNAGEKIHEKSKLLREFNGEIAAVFDGKEWIFAHPFKEQQITIDQLEELLNPSYAVKKVVLSLEELKSQAEKLGYTLYPKPYEPKVGDFGAFSDGDGGLTAFGFLTEITHNDFSYCKGVASYTNFRKLTEEEKIKIQESW